MSWTQARLTAREVSPVKFVLGAFSETGRLLGSVGLSVEENMNWSENALNLVLIGAAWVVADSLARPRRAARKGFDGTT